MMPPYCIGRHNILCEASRISYVTVTLFVRPQGVYIDSHYIISDVPRVSYAIYAARVILSTAMEKAVTYRAMNAYLVRVPLYTHSFRLSCI